MGDIWPKFDLSAVHNEKDWLKVEHDLKVGEFHFEGEKKLSWLGRIISFFQSKNTKNAKLFQKIEERAIEIISSDRNPDHLSVLLENRARLKNLFFSDLHVKVKSATIDIFNTKIQNKIGEFLRVEERQLAEAINDLCARSMDADLDDEKAILLLLETFDTAMESIGRQNDLSEKVPEEDLTEVQRELKDLKVLLEGRREELFQSFITRHPGKAMVKLTNGEYTLVNAITAVQSSRVLREMVLNLSEGDQVLEEGALKDLTKLPPIPEQAAKFLRNEIVASIPIYDDGKPLLELYQWIASWGIDSAKVVNMITNIDNLKKISSDVLFKIIMGGFVDLLDYKIPVPSLDYLYSKLSFFSIYDNNIPENLDELATVIYLITRYGRRVERRGVPTSNMFYHFTKARNVRQLLDYSYESKSTLLIDLMNELYKRNAGLYELHFVYNDFKDSLMRELKSHPHSEVLTPMVKDIFIIIHDKSIKPKQIIRKADLLKPFDRDLGKILIHRSDMGKDRVEVGDQIYYLNLSDSLKTKFQDPALLHKLSKYSEELFVALTEYLATGEIETPLTWEESIELYRFVKDIGEKKLESYAVFSAVRSFDGEKYSEILQKLSLPEESDLLRVLIYNVRSKFPGILDITPVGLEGGYRISLSADHNHVETLEWLTKHAHIFSSLEIKHSNYQSVEEQNVLLKMVKTFPKLDTLSLNLSYNVNPGEVVLSSQIWSKTISSHPELKLLLLNADLPFFFIPNAPQQPTKIEFETLAFEGALDPILALKLFPKPTKVLEVKENGGRGIYDMFEFLDYLNTHPYPIKEIRYKNGHQILYGLGLVAVPNLVRLIINPYEVTKFPDTLMEAIAQKNPQLEISFSE